LFATVLLLAVGLTLIVVPAERQRRAARRLEGLGGKVRYALTPPNASTGWLETKLRGWLPRDYFDDVTVVDLGAHSIMDPLAEKTPEVGASNWFGVRVTDSWLASVADLRGLQVLRLDGSEITDAGLMHLRDRQGTGST
jgi:hypothetical protein